MWWNLTYLCVGLFYGWMWKAAWDDYCYWRRGGGFEQRRSSSSSA